MKVNRWFQTLSAEKIAFGFGKISLPKEMSEKRRLHRTKMRNSAAKSRLFNKQQRKEK